MKKNLKMNPAKNRRQTRGDAVTPATPGVYGQLLSDISGLLEQARRGTEPRIYGKMSPDDEGEDTL